MASPNPVLGSGSSLMSVQELAKESMLTIPQHYICADQEPSTLSHGTSLPMIPMLDMEQLLMGEATDLELDKLHSICKEWGIFQLVNHGVSSLLVEKLKSEVEEFYKLPVEEKMKYKIKQGDVQEYGQTILVHEAQKVDWADRFYMITNPLYRRKPHLLPQLPCSLRETLESYISELQKLAMTLFGFMARALKIGKSEMEEMFGDGMQSMRMTYYPPCPQPQKVLGLTAHSDAAGLTILLQLNGVEGLQVKRDGNWIPVSILPNAFVVIVGDILEIFSNGLYKSIEHRATVNSVKERISIAMFFSPKFESEVGPSITLINPKKPPLFERVGMEKYFKDFVSRKLNGKSYLEQMRKNNGNENGEGHNTL